MQIQTQIRNPSDSSPTSSPATQSTTTTTTTTTNIANLGLQVRTEKETKMKPEAQNGTRGRGQQRQRQQNESNPKPKPRTKRQIMIAALELGMNERHLIMLKLLANYQMLTGFQICALSELPQYQYLRPRPRAHAKTNYEYDAGYLLDIYSVSSGITGSSAGGSVSGRGIGSTLSRIKGSVSAGNEFSFTKWLSNIRRQQFRRNSKLREARFVATTSHVKSDPAIAVWYITDEGLIYLNSQIPAWNKGSGSNTSVGAGAGGGAVIGVSQFLQLGHTVGVNQVVAGLVLATSEFTNALLRHTYQLELKAGISNDISSTSSRKAEPKQSGVVEWNWNSFYGLETDPFYVQFSASLPAQALAAGGTVTTPKPTKTKKTKAKAKEQAATVIYTPDLSGRISLQSSEPGLVQFALKVAGIADLDNMLLRATTAAATAATTTASASASAGATTSPIASSTNSPVALVQTRQPQQQAGQPPSLSKYLVPDNGFGIISSSSNITAEDVIGSSEDERPTAANASAVWPFFLEYDRATENLTVFAEKAVALTALFNDRKVWLPQWGGRFPTVLVVVEADSTYVGKLIKYTRSKLAEQKGRWGDNRPSSWWFTTMTAFEKVFTRTQESYYKFVDQPAKLASSFSNFIPVSMSGKSKSGQGQGQGEANSDVVARALPSTTPIWLPLTARGKPEEMVKHFDDWVRTLVAVGQDPSATKQIPVTVKDEDGQGTHTRKALVLDMANPVLKSHPQRNYGMVGLPILNFVG